MFKIIQQLYVEDHIHKYVHYIVVGIFVQSPTPEMLHHLKTVHNRVRTILLAFGYWELGDICRYWIVLLLGDIFCCCDTQYNTNQTAVGTVHTPVKDYLVPLVICTLTDAIVCLDTMLISYCLLSTIIVIIIEFCDLIEVVLYIFRFRLIHCNATQQYRYWYWVLVSLEANIIRYWVPCLASF